MSQAESIKGVIVVATTTSGWGWITENVTMSTIGFIGSLAATIACWLMLRKEKLVDSERHAATADALARIEVRTADDLAKIQVQMTGLLVNDVVLGGMLERINTQFPAKPKDQVKV